MRVSAVPNSFSMSRADTSYGADDSNLGVPRVFCAAFSSHDEHLDGDFSLRVQFFSRGGTECSHRPRGRRTGAQTQAPVDAKLPGGVRQRIANGPEVSCRVRNPDRAEGQ